MSYYFKIFYNNVIKKYASKSSDSLSATGILGASRTIVLKA